MRILTTLPQDDLTAVPAQGVEGYQEGFERKAPPAAPRPETPKGDSKGGKP